MCPDVPHTQTHFSIRKRMEGRKPPRWFQPALGSRASERRIFLDYWDMIDSLPSGAPLLWSPGTPDGSRQSPEWGKHLHWSLPWACVLACGPVFPLGCSVLETRSEQPVPALGSGSFFLLLPLALLLAEAACGSSLSSNDRLFLFGNRKDTVAATFFYPFSKHEA